MAEWSKALDLSFLDSQWTLVRASSNLAAARVFSFQVLKFYMDIMWTMWYEHCLVSDCSKLRYTASKSYNHDIYHLWNPRTESLE